MTGQKRRGILCILAALLSFFIVFGSLPGAGCSSSTTAGGSGSDQSGTQEAGGLGETGGGPADQSGAQASLNLDGQPVEFSINEAGAGSFERTVTDTTTGETHVEECQLTPIGSTTVGTCQDKAGGETLPCFFEYSTEGGQPTALECSNAGSRLPPSEDIGTIVVENNSLHADVDNDGVVDTVAIGETFAVKENNQEVAQCTTALVDDVLLLRCSGDGEHSCVLRFDQAEGTTNYKPTATTCPTEGEGPPPTSTEGSTGAGGEGPTGEGSTSGSPPPCTTDADCNLFIPEAYCDLATGFCALPPGVSP